MQDQFFYDLDAAIAIFGNGGIPITLDARTKVRYRDALVEIIKRTKGISSSPANPLDEPL